jgi:alpha-glucosidase
VSTERTDWWRGASIYQIYPRSFADANGDGTGDLAGVRSRLPYLAALGIDAVWFTPWYPSPMADGGYDVADYRAIDPRFGDLAEAEGLIRDALRHGIRTIIDVVPNHISDQHAWFRAALAAGPGSLERERFWFRDGAGADGSEPPNRWVSEFGGPAWTRVVGADGGPEQWYLHLFAPGQPDVNWGHPDVVTEHEEVLRFWLDRGASGIRIDSAALLAKDPALPDLDEPAGAGEHPYVDREDLQEIYRSWRKVAESYGPDRVLIGELWLPDAERFARYLRPGVLHSAFNFDYLASPWSAADLRRSITRTLSVHEGVGAPATWVLSNHDVTRPVTRYGRADTGFAFERKRFGIPTDPELGRRRARAAALLAMALPGAFYLYQGEELGLPEADIPRDRIDDPMHARSGGIDPGRDGCRVPLPWRGTEPPYGFSPETVETWLPQPADWAGLTVAAQEADPGSMLALYRTALALRGSRDDLGAAGPGADLAWLDLGPDALAFRRGPHLVSVTNFGDMPLDVFSGFLAGGTALLVSADLEGGLLPPDTTVWLTVS